MFFQTQLGHANPTVTLNVYAHLMKSENQEAACHYENLILNNSGSKKLKRSYDKSVTPCFFW